MGRGTRFQPRPVSVSPSWDPGLAKAPTDLVLQCWPVLRLFSPKCLFCETSTNKEATRASFSVLENRTLLVL